MPNEDASSPLGSFRARLDDVDGRIVDALAERQRLIAEVARHKDEAGDERLRDPEREAALLGAIVSRGEAAGLDATFVKRLFQAILDHSVRTQQEFLVDRQNPALRGKTDVIVAYQGTEGAYSHAAAARHFSARDVAARLVGRDTFAEILEAVAAGSADYAMLPIENTTAGSINEAYDLLAKMDLAIVGEEVQDVRHCLVTLEPLPLEEIRAVFSHPQALAQCSRFLASLEGCEVRSFTDTAMSVDKVRDDGDRTQAAIASEEAARLRGLVVVRREIANQPENFTRFVVVAREPVRFDPRIPCKTAMILATKHEEGALAECLRVLAEHHLNLTKLESRPRPNTPWEYLFYVDFEGNVAADGTRTALEKLGESTSFLKVLGSFPARTTKEAQPVEPGE